MKGVLKEYYSFNRLNVHHSKWSTCQLLNIEIKNKSLHRARLGSRYLHVWKQNFEKGDTTVHKMYKISPEIHPMFPTSKINHKPRSPKDTNGREKKNTYTQYAHVRSSHKYLKIRRLRLVMLHVKEITN